MSIESVMPPNHLILYHLLLPLPSIFPTTRVFSNESALHNRWPKYWSFSFGISPSNEYLELISFKIDCFDLLAVSQGTSQESSPVQQLESTNSSALSLLHGPTLTSVHAYWRNHSFDRTDLCWQRFTPFYFSTKVPWSFISLCFCSCSYLFLKNTFFLVNSYSSLLWKVLQGSQWQWLSDPFAQVACLLNSEHQTMRSLQRGPGLRFTLFIFVHPTLALCIVRAPYILAGWFN